MVLRPCGLLVIHFITAFSGAYLVLILWPPFTETQPLPVQVICGSAALWQHRVWDSTVTHTVLGASAIVARASATQVRNMDAAKARALSKNQSLEREGSISNTSQVQGQQFAQESNQSNVNASMVNASLPITREVLLRRNECFPWPGPGLWSRRRPLPAELCRAKCANFVAPEFWASNVIREHWALHNVWWLLDLIAVPGAALWVLGEAVSVERSRLLDPAPVYLARTKQVQVGLRRIFSVLTIQAIGHALLFRGALHAMDDWFFALCCCVLLELAAHGAAVFLSCLLLAIITTTVFLSWRMIVFSRMTLAFVVRLCQFLVQETVLDSSTELSLPQSSSFGLEGNGEEDLCAICLLPLHPTAPSCQGSFRTALSRFSPRLRQAATSPPTRRAPLVRLSKCQHAFHAACFEACAQHIKPSGRNSCPTCRTVNMRCNWRGRFITFTDLLDFVRGEVDFDYVRALILIVLIAALSSVLVQLMLIFMGYWINTAFSLHREYGIPWAVLNTPASAFFIFYIMLNLTRNIRTSFLISIIAAYPAALLCVLFPNLVVLCIVGSMLLNVVQI
eukprot:gnl/MRDRNA2_/MRDRNA2_19513_c0_seq1.p1 gnl/MRDRNA2_/MRDRNA2_19513_c0~~gnl/MRDRNA2_/MRDRNA2_19513_c0_seq1.p1  ORF type:complete len:564 (-),score=34.81 gnl/MRDRNA2_/MRDRNA2_19513_c0_seq1:24-1715(-)